MHWERGASRISPLLAARGSKRISLILDPTIAASFTREVRVLLSRQGDSLVELPISSSSSRGVVGTQQLNGAVALVKIGHSWQEAECLFAKDILKAFLEVIPEGSGTYWQGATCGSKGHLSVSGHLVRPKFDPNLVELDQHFTNNSSSSTNFGRG